MFREILRRHPAATAPTWTDVPSGWWLSTAKSRRISTMASLELAALGIYHPVQVPVGSLSLNHSFQSSALLTQIQASF